MHRMGIGRIFPIWYVNEGRYLVHPSVRGGDPSQQASMAKYQQQSRRTPHNLGGHGFVEQRVSCAAAVMSWARSSSPPPPRLSVYLPI